MTENLRDKVAIITGASSGIGAACARLLARQGCKLTLAARSRGKLEALAATLDTESLVTGADMTAPGDIAAMVEAALARFGRIDIMIANAGIWIRGPFAEGDIEALAKLMRLNVDAVIRCAHAALPTMREQGNGDIIVTSSISGHHDLVGEPVYSASKHAVQTFVRTLRRQVAGDGIRVMSIAPGPVANPMQGLHDPEDIRRVSADERRYLTSEDCAEAMLFMLTRPARVTVRDLVMLPQIDRV